MTAAERWAEQLAGWAIPPEILAQAPEPPWGFPVELFKAAPDPTETPSRQRALEALPDGGSVLDVGCGGGGASMALIPPAALVVGVDSSEAMLAEFAAAADARDVAHREHLGAWPEMAADVAPVDVVACHHVFYNVADLVPFAHALTSHARRRVVVELTAAHPLVHLAPLWRHFHGLDRPAGPTADLAVDVLREAGIDPQVERWMRPPREVPTEVYVRMNRRRLCLPASAEPEVAQLMADPHETGREVVTLWWDAPQREDDDAGAWVRCPRCGGRVGLARFAEADEELGAAVAVCPSCRERVVLPSGYCTTMSELPSGSRNQNIGGTGSPIRWTSASTSTPASRSWAW